jgi:hypothetical protein
MEQACHRFAHAEGFLLRDVARAVDVLGEVPEPLQQTPELRWMKGRIALAQGQAKDAFAALRPDLDGWPRDYYAIWDLAVASAIVDEEFVAREAYRRLLQDEPVDERARLAMRMEFAAVESRRGTEGVLTARTIMSGVVLADTDPDTCPWVSAMVVFLERLPPQTERSARFPCSLESRWTRLVGSSEGSALVFAEVARADSWLRLARNERVSMVALALGDTYGALRRRLWSMVDVRPQAPLSDLKSLECARLSARPARVRR